MIGEDLLLPSLATFWGGTEDGRANIRENLDRTMIAGAFRDRMPDLGLDRPVLGGELDAGRRERLRALIDRRGMDYAAQDVAAPASFTGPSCFVASRPRRWKAGG